MQDNPRTSSEAVASLVLDLQSVALDLELQGDGTGVRSRSLFSPWRVAIALLSLGCGPPCELAVLEGAVTMNGHVQTDVLVEATHPEHGLRTATTDDWGTWELELEPGTWEIVMDHSCWSFDHGEDAEPVELDCEGLIYDVDLSYCWN